MQPVRPEPLLSHEDYAAIEAAVMETARGRWFLAEFARRNRRADTEIVLAAIRRLERLVQNAASLRAHDEVTKGMADIAQAIAAAQVVPAAPAELAASVDAHTQMAEENSVHEGEHFVHEDAAPVQADVGALDSVDNRPVDVIEHESVLIEDKHASAAVEPEEPASVELAGDTTQPGQDGVEKSEWEQLEVVALAREPTPSEVDDEPAEASPVAKRDIIDELEIFLAETARETQANPAGTDPPVAMPSSRTEIETSVESFPIIELDEAAAEALMTQDPRRHELILPSNHVVTQRWSKDFLHEVAQTADNIEPVTDEPLRTSLVTFVDEEPVDESESVFSAPLRLEPEEASDVEAEPVVTPIHSRNPPSITISEIEAMPFTKKAVLFS